MHETVKLTSFTTNILLTYTNWTLSIWTETNHVYSKSKQDVQIHNHLYAIQHKTNYKHDTKEPRQNARNFANSAWNLSMHIAVKSCSGCLNMSKKNKKKENTTRQQHWSTVTKKKVILNRQYSGDMLDHDIRFTGLYWSVGYIYC